eukprot:scaffold12086_cov72-Skeletonema_dohrnii-CCMP3373.AAC.1
MKVYFATLLTVLGISATTAFLAPRSGSVSSTTCKSSLEESLLRHPAISARHLGHNRLSCSSLQRQQRVINYMQIELG